MVSAVVTQTVAGVPGYDPTGALEWVQVKGTTLYNWESAQTPPPTGTFNNPTGQFYLVEMRGRFGPSSTQFKTVAFIALATHDSGTPSRGVALPLNGQWESNHFLSLSRLGSVHYAALPSMKRVVPGRVPNLIGLSYLEAQALLHGQGSTLEASNVDHFDSYLPPFTVMAQAPSSGQQLRRGAVVDIKINM